MNVTVKIPGDLPRRALEAPALEEDRTGHMTEAELQSLLGFGTRYKLDGFLKEHGVFIEHTLEDSRREVASLDRLGL